MKSEYGSERRQFDRNSITIMIFLVSQLVAWVWWASGVTKTLEIQSKQLITLEESFKSVVNDRYRSVDATRDLAIRDLVHSDLKNQISKIEERLFNVEKIVGRRK